MKTKLVLTFLTILLASPASLIADHTGGSAGVARLLNTANQLQYQVNCSYLRPQVKQSVYRLVQEVNMYYNCAVRTPGLWDDHNPGTYSCEYNEQRVLQVWYSVDRFLSDTYYDFPQVYQAYQQMRYEIEQLR